MTESYDPAKFESNNYTIKTPVYDEIMKEREQQKELSVMTEPISFMSSNTQLSPDALLDVGTFKPIVSEPLDTGLLFNTKPRVEEELSKIHEELAKQNQDNNELRKENKEQREENEQLKQENEKLKTKLKKTKDKAKSTNKIQKHNRDQMQQEIDDLQIDMNEVKDLVDWKRYNK